MVWAYRSNSCFEDDVAKKLFFLETAVHTKQQNYGCIFLKRSKKVRINTNSLQKQNNPNHSLHEHIWFHQRNTCKFKGLSLLKMFNFHFPFN